MNETNEPQVFYYGVFLLLYIYMFYFVILVTVIGFLPLETVIKYTLLSNQKISYDIHNPRIKPRSPALQADTLTSEPPGKP